MDQAFTILNSITLLSIVKLLILALLAVYCVFAYLMSRMAGSMTKAVQMNDGFVINILAMAHLAFAVIVLVIAIVVL